MARMEELLAGDEDYSGSMEIAGLEIVGYDDSGAPLMRAKKPNLGRAVQRAEVQRAAQAVAANRPVLLNKEPTKRREYPLGIDSVAAIAAAAETTVTANPQVPFKPTRFIINGASNWLLNDIKVGKNSQFVASGAQAGEAFGATAFGAELEFDTCPVGGQIVVTATNISGGALRFTGTFFGVAVE